MPPSLSSLSLLVLVYERKSPCDTACQNPAPADSPGSGHACARKLRSGFRNLPSPDQISLALLPHAPSCPCTHLYTWDSRSSRRCTRQWRPQPLVSSGTLL